MKRYGKSERLWIKICDANNVERAMRDILIPHKYPGMKRSDYSAEQKNVLAHWRECKDYVVRTLSDETYQLGKLRHNTIFDRKKRELHFPVTFPDKVYYRCVYNVLKPYFYEKFTHNTYNCIEGRGILKAKRAVEKMMLSMPDGYYVQSDCKKYYDSIVHRILRLKLYRMFKCNKVLMFFDRMLEVYNSGYSIVADMTDEIVGLAIGINLTQLLAIFNRSVIMHRIIRKYGSANCISIDFTDDLITGGFRTKKEAHNFLSWYVESCRAQGQTIKPSARIAPMSEPIRAFGFVFKLDDSGKPYTLLRKNIKERMKQKDAALRKMNVSDEVYKQQMASYYGWCKYANCRHLMRVIMKEKYRLFEQLEMERLQRLAERRENEIVDFGLTAKQRVPLPKLEDCDIVLLDAACSIRYFEKAKNKDTGELEDRPKFVFKFRYVDSDEEHFTITTSESLIDRIKSAVSLAPCVCTLCKQRSRYDNKLYYVLK